MIFDDMEDTEKGPFCKPFGQLFYENLEKMPSFQIVEAYLSLLLDAQDKIQKAIAILEGALKKGAERLKEIKNPSELQFYFGKITNARGEIEKEIERLSRNRRDIESLISEYSEKGVFNVPLKEFMLAFDSEYPIKVEKKHIDSDECYITEIKATDLIGCAGFEHLNRMMTGYILKKLLSAK
jgi:tetratricopeptide (TPR) repeat protein|uniref:Uncharacterized protein n=1 Tax=candidate division WOR-3 bacterium TaxID=2052148 RepID=A0A7C4TBM0_UNCW3